jgi:hypothetical protein
VIVVCTPTGYGLRCPQFVRSSEYTIMAVNLCQVDMYIHLSDKPSSPLCIPWFRPLADETIEEVQRR